MHSSLLTLQISINIPHLTLPGSGAGGGGACRPQNGAQAAKLWLPELSVNFLVLKKVCPASHCPVCDLFVVRIKDAYLMLMQNIIWKPKRLLYKSLLGSILFLLNNNLHCIPPTNIHPHRCYVRMCVKEVLFLYTRSIRRI